jgi:glutamate dehydrogenase/leucine dehydrogenase
VKQETGAVNKYEPGRRDCSENILDINADILITAAKPDLIKARDVDKLRFRLIVEGSNIPMTYDVEEICFMKNILVVPDIIANAGGVISSYVEYVGGEAALVSGLIQEKITNNVSMILREAKGRKRSPRKCALEIARDRVRKRCNVCKFLGA